MVSSPIPAYGLLYKSTAWYGDEKKIRIQSHAKARPWVTAFYLIRTVSVTTNLHKMRFGLRLPDDGFGNELIKKLEKGIRFAFFVEMERDVASPYKPYTAATTTTTTTTTRTTIIGTKARHDQV